MPRPVADRLGRHWRGRGVYDDRRCRPAAHLSQRVGGARSDARPDQWPAWHDRLREGGRMVVPLTVGMGKTLGKGVVAKIIRQGACFSARTITFVVIYSCASVRDSQLEPTLGKAMATGALMKMQSVRRDA